MLDRRWLGMRLTHVSPWRNVWAERLVGIAPVEHITTFSTGELGEGAGPTHSYTDIVIGRPGSEDRSDKSHDSHMTRSIINNQLTCCSVVKCSDFRYSHAHCITIHISWLNRHGRSWIRCRPINFKLWWYDVCVERFDSVVKTRSRQRTPIFTVNGQWAREKERGLSDCGKKMTKIITISVEKTKQLKSSHNYCSRAFHLCNLYRGLPDWQTAYMNMRLTVKAVFSFKTHRAVTRGHASWTHPWVTERTQPGAFSWRKRDYDNKLVS